MNDDRAPLSQTTSPENAFNNALTKAIIPAELLYWGHLPRDTAQGDAMRFHFERLLPIPVELVHVTSTMLADRSSLVVGIELDRLRAYLGTRADISPATWALVPDRTPDHVVALVGNSNVHERLNLFHGEFEPAPRLRLRRITAGFVHLGLAIMLIMVVLGVERRTQAAQQFSQQQREANLRAIEQLVPPQPGMRAEMSLTMALRRLDQAARNPEQQPNDLTAVLQGLWQQWPADLRVQVDLCSAQNDRITIRGRTTSLADAEHFAQAFENLTVNQQRYRMEPLQAQQDRRGATFLLVLARAADSRQP